MRILLTAVVLAVALASAAAYQTTGPAAKERAEGAYRANNAGVAALERFDYATAAAEFRKALAIDSSIGIARVNLAIALQYGGDADAFKEAKAAAEAMPKEPRAWYVLGLSARAAREEAEALAAFQRVLELDPADAASLTNLGQLHLEAGRYPQAIERLTAAAAAEPFNATAAYSLALALLRGGRREEGQESMKRFQALRDAPYAVTYSAAYLQQGRYGEALVSTGSEPQLVDAAVPKITFVDIAAEALGPNLPAGTASLSIVDADADGDLDLVLAGTAGARLYKREGQGWKPSPALAFTKAARGAVGGDYDNDGRTDIVVLGDRGLTLWRQREGGAFEDVTSAAALAKAAGGRSAAFTDLDHDGDVDLVTAGAPEAGAAPLEAWRNNGNGTFARFDAASGLQAPAGAAVVVPTDYNIGRDMDLLVPGSDGVALLENLRDGRFEDVAASAGLRGRGFQAAAAGDVNGDGRPDYFLGRADAPGLLLMSDRSEAFRAEDAPAATAGALAAQLLDYDGDGVTDLVTLGGSGLRVLRGTGGRWTDVTAASGIPESSCRACALASADLDDDGDIDLAAVESGRVRLWRNDGPPQRSLTIRLASRVSNKSAAGARVEVRAGSLLRRFETSAAMPATTPADIVVGLGGREGADVVRVVWPSGIVQAEIPEKAVAGRQRAEINELDRKPSSCPYLFTWNGSRFEFVSDFLGGGEMGYWLAPGVRNVPDPEEYVRLRGDQLVARNGRYELRVTNELEEALFLDRLSLVAVTHRAGTEIYPNEGLFAPPYPAHRLFVTEGARVPDRVVDDHGHDVRELIERVDRRAPSDFQLERFRGYAREHHLELSIPERRTGRLLLLLTAWTDYAFSSDNVAASQAGVSLTPPSLELLGPDGRWTAVIPNIGIPVGRPQTVVVDLTDRVPRSAVRLRIRTNMRIHWDRILFDTSEQQDGQLRRVRLPLRSADLRWRGYSAQVSPDGREPFGYDYAQVLFSSPWKLMPGRYTREGDVRELVSATDDLFVVSRPGDEVAISFDALPPPPPGWTRTFLLHADGFSKEMDPNSASPDVAWPLPYHGMKSYPDDPLSRPLTAAQREYVERYNTRVVTRQLPTLATAAAVTGGK